MVEMVPGRKLLRGEGRVLRTKEEMNHRDNERTIHQLTLEFPGEGHFLGVRRLRKRVKWIIFSRAIDSRLGHIPISLLGVFVRTQQPKIRKVGRLTARVTSTCELESEVEVRSVMRRSGTVP